MKKKLLVLSLLPLLSASLNGCKDSSKVQLTYGSYIVSDSAKESDNNTFKISYNDLYSKVSDESDDKENFLLIVYSETCSCWSMYFQVTVKEFIAKYHYKIYTIGYSELENKEQFGLILNSGKSTLAIFENKKIFKQYLSNLEADMYLNPDSLKKELDKYTLAPKIYLVDEERLDEKLTSNQENIVYFGRTSCGDCQFVNPNGLFPLVNQGIINKEILLLDLDTWYSKDGNSIEQNPKYNEIKAKYGLCYNTQEGLDPKFVGNPIFGFGGGVVPTFQYYKNNVLTDMMVYLNETLTADDENQQWIISNSYYSEERIEVLTFLKGIPLEEAVLTGQTISYEFIPKNERERPDSIKRKQYLSTFYNHHLELFMSTYAK